MDILHNLLRLLLFLCGCVLLSVFSKCVLFQACRFVWIPALSIMTSSPQLPGLWAQWWGLIMAIYLGRAREFLL